MKEKIILFLKGLAMGAADVVPGVSGGTIALISKIYEELIDSLKKIDFFVIKLLFKEGFFSFWKYINGNFLLPVFLGIITSIFSLAKLINFLLDNYPVFVWSFFFGLIFISVFFVFKRIKKITIPALIFFFLSTFISYYITKISPATTPENLLFVFLSGVIAICAMILPGISGSFILLLLGKYQFILSAVSDLKITVLLTFTFGCLSGLILFSKLLSFLLHKFHNITIASLSGFMLGALNKVWPWKKTILFYKNSKGEIIPLLEKNISPLNFDGNNHLTMAIVMFIIGCITIYILESLNDYAKK